MKRPDSGPRPLSDLLQFGDIASIEREARRRQALVDEIRARLPAAEAAHVVGAELDSDGALVISVDSAVWAARLRFAELDGSPVRVRVAPPGDGGR